MVPEIIKHGSFALALLVTLDLSMWHWMHSGLSSHYCGDKPLPRSPFYPKRKRFVLVKSFLGLTFVVALVAGLGMDGPQHTALGIATVGLLLPFSIVSAWERVAAFRYYAEHHLPPVDRDGYVQRWRP